MAIADTITSMQNHTSNAYTMIGYGTDLTGINKNLENLSSTIFEAFLEALRNPDTLFTNLPKTSGSGSQITLNGTAYAPMRITLNPTAISQTTYTGKNLLNIFNVNSTNSTTHSESGNTLVITSTSANANCYISYKITNVLPDTIYTISGSAVADNTQYISIRNYKTGGGYGVALNINNTTINSSFTTTSDVDYLVIFLYSGQSNSSGSVGDKTTFTNLQLEKSSTKTDYEPYVGGTASPNPSYPQDIHTISGNNSVVVEGKNILELPDGTFTNRGITSTISNGVINCSGTATGNYAELYSGNTTNLASGTYTFSIKEAISVPIRFRYFVNGTRKDAIINANETSVSFTASDNIEDGFVYLPTLSSGTTYNLTIYPMIEKGSTATTYTPYVSQTAPINLGTENLIDIYTLNNGYINSSGGTAPQTSGSYERYSPFIKVKPNTEYTFKILECTWENFGTYNWIGVGEYTSDSDSSFIQRDTMTTKSQDYYTFTTTATTQYVRISARGLTYATKIQFSEEALWKDKNVYTPFGTNIEYCKIGDYEDKFIRSGGEQLANFTTLTLSGDKTITNGSVDATSVSSSATATFKFSETTLSSGNYCFYFKTTRVGSSGSNQILADASNTQLGTFQFLGTGTSYCDFTLENPTTISSFKMWFPGTYGGVISEISLIKGTHDNISTYIPYEKGWYYKQGIGKVVLTGSYAENWALDTTKTITQVFNSNNAITNRLMSNINYFCNYFTTQEGDTEKIAFTTDQNRVYLAINKTTASSEAELRTWLSTHNTEIYYVMETPTYTKITGELANQLEQVYKGMLSYDGTTNISQVNNDLAFELIGSAITK